MGCFKFYIIALLSFLLLELDHQLELEQRLAQIPNVQILKNVADEVFCGRLLVLLTKIVIGRVAYDVKQILRLASQRRLEKLIRFEQVIALVVASLFNRSELAYFLEDMQCKLIQFPSKINPISFINFFVVLS
jgi:hypothetical protein